MMKRTLSINPMIVNPQNFDELSYRFLRMPYCAVRDLLMSVRGYCGSNVKIRFSKKPQVYNGNIYTTLVDIETTSSAAVAGTLENVFSHLTSLIPECMNDYKIPRNKVVEVARVGEGIKILGMLDDIEE